MRLPWNRALLIRLCASGFVGCLLMAALLMLAYWIPTFHLILIALFVFTALLSIIALAFVESQPRDDRPPVTPKSRPPIRSAKRPQPTPAGSSDADLKTTPHPRPRGPKGAAPTPAPQSNDEEFFEAVLIPEPCVYVYVAQPCGWQSFAVEPGNRTVPVGMVLGMGLDHEEVIAHYRNRFGLEGGAPVVVRPQPSSRPDAQLFIVTSL